MKKLLLPIFLTLFFLIILVATYSVQANKIKTLQNTQGELDNIISSITEDLSTVKSRIVKVGENDVIKGDPGPQGEKGEKGDQGEKGEQGLKGDTGSPGVSGYEKVCSERASGYNSSQVYCPSGKKVISFACQSFSTNVALIGSYYQLNETGARCNWESSVDAQVCAICASAN